jgi:hypothetical protein
MRHQTARSRVVNEASATASVRHGDDPVTTPEQDAAFERYLDDMDDLYEGLETMIKREVASNPPASRRHHRHEHRRGRAA